jgi:polysaccharide biosynthesis transport protein
MQYVDSLNREREWSKRYGTEHTAVVNLRKQIRDIRLSIRDELGRIAETYKSEYEIAVKRRDELEKALAALISQSQETNQAQVALFSLESAAQSYRRLYDNFLQRHTESVQQQSYPISNARSVSSATALKTGPKTAQVLAFTLLGGALLGLGLGALREIMDRGFRTVEQVRSILRTECLALVPRLTDGGRWKVLQFFREQPAVMVQPRIRVAVSMDDTPDQLKFNDVNMAPRAIRPSSAMLRNVIDDPSSPYMEAIRSIKLNLDMRREAASSKVIGLTSCLPGEGKSTVARAIATFMAQSGARAILIDGDLRNPSLSRTLAPTAKVGWPDIVNRKAGLADAVWTDPVTKLRFLPIAPNTRKQNTAEIFTSDAARSLFSTLQMQFDYVIVDFSPIISSMELRAGSLLIDSFILVVEWGQTKIDAVQYALRNVSGLQDSLIGAVLNKVDLASLGSYDHYGSQVYYGPSGTRLQ